MKVVPVLTILAFLAMMSVSSAATITVGKGGYSTIQEALNASSEGDIIQLDRGIYAENLFVGKSISIAGSGNDTVIQPHIWTQPTIQIMSNNVSIEGVRIINGSTAVKVIWSENVSVKNSTIEGNNRGIWLTGGARNKVIGNAFKENRVHVFFEDTMLNVIYQNKLNRGATGISMIISGFNNITENIVESCEVCISLRNSAYNFIGGNELTNCGIGLLSEFSSWNTISGNRVNATQTFLDLTVTSNNLISANEFEGSGVYAKNFDSLENKFMLVRVNLTGLNFEFSLMNFSLPENYVALSEAINVTIIPDILTETGYIYMESNLTEEDVKNLSSKVDLSNIAFYRMDSGSPVRVSQGLGHANFTSNQSGIYILAGEKETRTDGIMPESGFSGYYFLFLLLLFIALVVTFIRKYGRKN
ncbi:MAG: hypothetical protein PWQ22_1501 [Archaeoglobaceae archaeon]|nr:hypothetical protein [Archaeoglobaceae archaeon]MDK2877091.1 hypothetical protein [Archaeoglobaceae archaeon]